MSLTELPAALDNALMVSRSGLQRAAVTSFGDKLQCLRIQVRQIARERDKARLDLEKTERCCLQLGRELDEQHITLEHTQSKLRDFQAEIEAKEQLWQQTARHLEKLEAERQFLQSKEARLQGRLNCVMKENTQLQNKVTEMAEKLVASEKLVQELQKELSWAVKDKLGQLEPHSPELPKQSERFAEIVLEYERQCQVLWNQNEVLRKELERLRFQLQESQDERGLPAGGGSAQGSSLPAGHSSSPLLPPFACTETSLPIEQLQEQLRNLKEQLETKINYYEEEVNIMRKSSEGERKDSEKTFKAEIHKMEDQKRDLEETVAKYWAVTDSLKEQKHVWSLELERFEMEQPRVALQHTSDVCHPEHQQQQGEELRRQRRDRESRREELCWLLEENSLLRSQLGRLQQELRSGEAVLAERAAQLKDAQAQLCRNELLIGDLHEENRVFAVTLKATELKQKSTEEKKQLLEAQASALKQLIGKITTSLSS